MVVGNVFGSKFCAVVDRFGLCRQKDVPHLGMRAGADPGRGHRGLLTSLFDLAIMSQRLVAGHVPMLGTTYVAHS